MGNVKLQHVRSLGYCLKGIKKFLIKHNLDWKTFLKEGLPEEIITNINDEMAAKAIEQMRSLENGK